MHIYNEALRYKYLKHCTWSSTGNKKRTQICWVTNLWSKNHEPLKNCHEHHSLFSNNYRVDKDLETRAEVNHVQRAHTRKQHAFRKQQESDILVNLVLKEIIKKAHWNQAQLTSEASCWLGVFMRTARTVRTQSVSFMRWKSSLRAE